MLGESEEPPGTMEGGPPETPLEEKKTGEQSKSQLESLKEIMLRNKQSLKKKEEEVQEYASRLSKIKSRTKLSKRGKEGAQTSREVEQSSKIDTLDNPEEMIDDISQATTSKAKSSLLQRKLAENRKVFEQRNKEITKTKRAVEEKVEAIRQQLDGKELALNELQKEQTVVPLMITSEILTSMSQSAQSQEKDNRIMELNNKISHLEAMIIDLQENLREKDSVIDSKTKAITLMSADLSKKGKTTLDTLEDTKDEMRTMQEHFVLLESSLKQKNENLLQQLHERDNRISELDDTIKKYEDELTEKKLTEIANADLSRTTLDTLADTKSAMKSMQENFILIESSLKMKNDNLLKQLENYEIKLAEANERIFQLESGKGIVKTPEVEDLQYKLNKLEQSNRQLQDEKYELQKSIADMQNRIIASNSMHGNGVIMEKDNRIAELENLIEELKRSNDLLKEESKTELQQQLADLSAKNEEYSNRITELEKLVHNLEVEKNEVASLPPPEVSLQKENEKIQKLTKELEELNKSMIKIKAQHKSKVKNLQKQLENFKMVSDTNAELVRLGNQVALLEEEKASAGDWQERIAELESRVSMQNDEMQKHIDAIAILENQKLDLIQELHSSKQKISELEAEIADSENHRVTAEMKVVDLEEQLEAVHKMDAENRPEISPNVSELLQKIESLQQENVELSSKLGKLEEKGASDTGSTESFETIQEVDKNELLKKIEDLTQKNDELILKLAKFEEKNSSHAGSTESFEAINDLDKNELLKKIEQLTQENNDLIVKLSRNDEKGSSDTGSTESFERIPEHNESLAKIELLTQENHELVIKITKLEEKLLNLETYHSEVLESNDILQIRKNELDKQNESLVHTINNLADDLMKLRTQVSDTKETNTKLQEHLNMLQEERSNSTDRPTRSVDDVDRMNLLMEEKINLEKELMSLQERLLDQANSLALHEIETNDTKLRMNKLLEENHQIVMKMRKLEEINQNLMDDLSKVDQEKEDKRKEERKDVQSQESVQGTSESIIVLESNVISSLEAEMKICKEVMAEQSKLIEEMRLKISRNDEELETNRKLLLDYEAFEKECKALKDELKKSSDSTEEWKAKCEILNTSILNLEEANAELVNVIAQKETSTNELESTITVLQSKLESEQERILQVQDKIDMAEETIKEKDKLLTEKCEDIRLRDIRILSIEEELVMLKDALRSKDDDIYSLEKKNSELEEKLRESTPNKEYEKLLIELRDNEILINNMQNKIDERLKEKHDLLAQFENLYQQNQDQQQQLAERNEELKNLLTMKEESEVQLVEMKRARTDSERKILDLESSLENNIQITEDLRSQLNDNYKMMEQLKSKHMDDLETHNRKLEDTIGELNFKIQECESLRAKLEEREGKQADLEQKLADSESKKQAQLEKMKKIVVALERKKALCQEFEARIAELEEKWMSEKDEKEAKNKKNQEVESAMREKDNKITELEERLSVARNEADDSLAHVERLTGEVATMREKMSSLVAQINELEDEIESSRIRLKECTVELQAEKLAKENILEEYESYKKRFLEKYDQQQSILEETKENARELSVRMEVMETEYVEQLALIQNLQAENALLLSKQMQINERLENTEKESEERRLLVEELRKQLVSSPTVETATQTSEEDARTVTTQCDHCEQCQTIVQALEAKLQEREAEIENLDNELANSIGNFVQMRESLRFNDMMNQSGMRNRTMEDPYNDLLYQYNALFAHSEEIKGKLEYMVKQNEEFVDKIKHLESLNATLEESAIGDKESMEKLQNVHSLYTDLLEKYEERGNELQTLQEKMEALRNETRQSVEVLERETAELKSEKNELQEKCKTLNDQKEGLEKKFALVTEENKENSGKLANLTSELNELKNKNDSTIVETVAIAPTESTEVVSEERYPAPALFDASRIFGPQIDEGSEETAKLQDLLNDRDVRCTALKLDVDNLQRQMNEEKARMLESRDTYEEELKASRERCRAMETEMENLRHIVEEKIKRIESLSEETRNVEARIEELRVAKDDEIRSLQVELNSTRDALNALSVQRDEQNQLLTTYVERISDLERELGNSTSNDTVAELQHRLMELVQERDALQARTNDLVRPLEEVTMSVKKDLSSEQMDRKELKDGTTQTSEPIADSSEKLNVDEDTWGWNAEDVQSTDESHFAKISIVPSTEIQLRTKLDEMEKRVELLENEKTKLMEEGKAAQIRSGKMVKKLKEYKVQIENLQQQLKSQKSVAGFCELDTAIEEELRSRIAELEKNLKELNEEHRNALVEKEALTKRIDVIVSANERYLEMKERQDMEMEVLRIQNKDLTKKLESLETQPRFETPFESADLFASTERASASVERLEKRETVKENEDDNATKEMKRLCDKYKEELESTRDDMEALATENEQLQHFLEEQKTRISMLEKKVAGSENDREEWEKARKRNDELEALLRKSNEESEERRKVLETRLGEISEEASKLEKETKELRELLGASERKTEETINEGRITEEKLFAVSESLTEVTDLLNSRVQEVADLKQELQKQYVSRQDAEGKLNEEIQRLTQELQERKEEVEELRASFSAKESECIQRKSVETVSFLVSEATQELMQKHAIEIEERNKEIWNLREKVTALEATAEDYLARLSKGPTEEEVASLSQNLRDKEALLEIVKAELTSLKEYVLRQRLDLEEALRNRAADAAEYSSRIEQLEKCLTESESFTVSLREQVERLPELERELADSRAELSAKELLQSKLEEESRAREQDMHRLEEMRKDLRDGAEEIIRLTAELETTRLALVEAKNGLKEKDDSLKALEERLNEKQRELDALSVSNSFQTLQSSSANATVDGLPLFTMGGDTEETLQLRIMIQNLTSQLDEKRQEIEHLKYVIEENTYPQIIQEMQGRINYLYNEKAELENAMRTTVHGLTEKQRQVEDLTKRLETREEESSTVSRTRRSVQDEEEIVQLQNELHSKEQEINELRYVIAEKDSQLSQVSSDPASDDYELRESVRGLTAELYTKEEEIRQLKSTIDEARNEILRLRDIERVAEERRNAIERLTSEMEAVRTESENLLERKLAEKEAEIDAIKQRLSMEREEVLGKLLSREQDVENLKRKLESSSMERDEVVSAKVEELRIANAHLHEQEKRYTELIFTKDAEIQNLTIQIHEKSVRIEELQMLYEKKESEAAELRRFVEEKETEIGELKDRLDIKVKEYEAIQRTLKKDFSTSEAQAQEDEAATRAPFLVDESTASKDTYSNEFDFALNMLHQRDLRCEELTHELMQLLEERDTLQLRLSNAIRINEELRKISSSDSNSKKDEPAPSETTDEPLIEHPSPSKSDGPVEIAKEAIDSPVKEDKEALSLKLSQLHTVGHTKDVRLKDDRELRHRQQMSLLTHKDVLSTLPPEAAAKLVNANYTLSRDVQSQSSVLLNWLWGKSTPKVIHM